MSCSICNKKTRGADSVTCDICRKNVHVDCVGLSFAEAECLRANGRRIHFFCARCDIVSTINTLQSEIELLKSDLKEMKNVTSKVIEDQPEIGENAAEEEINLLKSEINQLKSDIGGIKSKPAGVNSPGHNKNLSEEEIIFEAEERSRRANNLILFNLRESSETTSTKRQEDDLARCRQIILPNGDNGNEITIISCQRLGKFDNTKTRPLKIILGTAQQAVHVLKHYTRQGNFYINRDLTRRQQNYCYQIRVEYKSRKRDENDITLKYRNGIPRIVRVNEKNVKRPNSPRLDSSQLNLA
jgi:uncharacterized small protein (DUF1192 family)